MTEIIDAHHHFWQPVRGDYGWMPKDDRVLYRPYLPKDLSPTLQKADVIRTVLVQAAPSPAETEYLLGLADAFAPIAKVVGWVDFEDKAQISVLERFANHPKFAGVRPMIQDIADPDWMLRSDIQWAFDAICRLDLTFDCLGLPVHLDRFAQLLHRYPDMRVVIDHAMKPSIDAPIGNEFSRWADGMTRLAADTRAMCKLSGLVTESKTLPDTDSLRPFVDHILSVFGPERVMWGSDWPVVRLRCEYDEWLSMAQQLTSHLSPQDQSQIFCQTAKAFYRIQT